MTENTSVFYTIAWGKKPGTLIAAIYSKTGYIQYLEYLK
jgi:hypothetical protein